MARRWAVFAISFSIAVAPALPCAPAPPRGVTVTILDETALIVWDEASHTEHFIRGASFRTEAKDFGFLVPTPAEPELGEAKEWVFDRLDSAIQPTVEYRKTFGGPVPTALVCFPYLMMTGGSRSAMDGARPPVRVLQTARVSGYDAAVLEADDAAALARWLEEHGYDNRPTLAAWLAPYVDAGAKITAFKVARSSDEKSVGTSAVRMTFHADRPFFPYREPADQRQDKTPRKLFVYFVASGRVDGSVGTAAWQGKVLWSDRIVDPKTLLDGALPDQAALPQGAWLTAFEDSSSPRSGDEDLFFAPSARNEPFRPAPLVVDQKWYLPVPIDLLLVIVGIFVWRVRRRRKA